MTIILDKLDREKKKPIKIGKLSSLVDKLSAMIKGIHRLKFDDWFYNLLFMCSKSFFALDVFQVIELYKKT